MNLRFLFIIVALAPATLFAENWPNWRGPNQDGVASGSGYPVEWSDTKNVAWKTPLPGEGSSTPAVWEDQVLVTCGNKTGLNTLMSVRRGDGQLQWTLELGKERPGKHQRASGSNPSPVTDGKYVFAYYKSGDLAGASLDGKLLWQRNLQKEYGKDTLWWDLGTSPVLTKDFVVIACMQTGASYVAAFHKATGKVAWKHDRMLDAPVEAAQSYTTPLVVDVDGAEQIIIAGADHITAHEADSGKEIWRVGGLNPTQNQYFRSISSPVLVDDLVIAPYARGDSLTAVRLGGSGDVRDSHVVWSVEEKGSAADVPTPAAQGGRIYVCHDKQGITCRDAKTGAVLWQFRAPGNRNPYSSSPILADGRLYMTRQDGTTLVVDTRGEKPKLLATNTLKDQFTVATPVFVDGQIFLRSKTTLFCLGNSGAE